MLEECDFCKEFETNQLRLSNGQVVLENRIIFESPHFKVFPTIGCLVEGYVLIVPTMHCYSLAQLPMGLYSELEEVVQLVKQAVERQYEKPVLFEHGAKDCLNRGGACVDHAHLHVVPGSYQLSKFIGKNWNSKPISKLSDLKTTQSEYLLVEENDKRTVFEPTEKIESQLIRKIIAKQTNQASQWDWGFFPKMDQLNATVQKLKPALAQKESMFKV